MRRPDDFDEHDESLPPELETELERFAARHRGDPSFAVLRAAEADALTQEVSASVANGIAASRWQQSIVRGGTSAAEDADMDEVASARLLARIHRDAAARDAGARRTKRGAALALAGVAAAAVLAVTTMIVRRDAVPSAVVVEAPPVAVATVAPPAFRIPLEAAPMKLTPRALVLRSDAGQPSFVDDVAPAFDAYRGGQYQAAADAFARLRTRYRDSVEIAFYLGVSRLMTGDIDGARAALGDARAMNDATFADDVAWYLAVADERAGNLSSARTAMAALCAGAGELATRACSAASALPEP
jgi:hypothetical protein